MADPITITAMLCLTACAPAEIRVTDGDTIAIERSIWQSGSGDRSRRSGRRVSLRLETIDAPELRGECRAESDLAAAAHQALADQLIEARRVMITWSGRLDRYDRPLVTVTVEDRDGDRSVHARDVAEELIARRLAARWSGRREDWCK